MKWNIGGNIPSFSIGGRVITSVSHGTPTPSSKIVVLPERWLAAFATNSLSIRYALLYAHRASPTYCLL